MFLPFPLNFTKLDKEKLDIAILSSSLITGFVLFKLAF